MLTARKLVRHCAVAALGVGLLQEWIAIRDGLFLGSRATSFRAACLEALREIGLVDTAARLLMDEAENERNRGEGVLAFVDAHR